MPLKDMSDEQPKPPKSGRGKKEGKKTPPSEPSAPTSVESPWKTLEDGSRVRHGRRLPYETQMHQFFTEISGLVAMADSFSAQIIENKSEELAYGYAKLAKDDPRIKAFFERLLQGSAYSAALIPTVTMAVAIGWHFGLVPGQLGVPMVLASGSLPYTRQQEQEFKEAQRKEQADAARQAESTHPRGEAPNGDGDNPN